MQRSEIITHAGQSMTLKQWATLLGVQYKTLWMRLRDGMPYEKAFAKKVERPRVPRNLEKTVTKTCLNCSASFVIPRSRDWREHCCSSECKTAHRAKQTEALRLERTRACKHCGASFVAKKSQLDEGGGNYCSMECHRSVFGLSAINNPEAQARGRAKLKELRDAGKIRYLRGPESPCWKGGKYARTIRNAPIMREACRRRRIRIGGNKLPPGTVEKMLIAQKNKCPVCRKALRGKYHLDHIVPLARGGEHVQSNVQILCPPCNVRKSAKDPIKFMQERGFLL